MKKKKPAGKAGAAAPKPGPPPPTAGYTPHSIEELRASEAKYRFLTERMNDIVWTTDLGINVTYVGPSIEQVLGFTPDELMGQPFEKQVLPETLRLAREKLAEELKLDRERDPDRSIILDLDYYHKDGSIRNLETRISFIRDEEGNPTGIHGLSRDVTDRKKAEKALRESEERYRYLFDGSRDALMTLGPPLWRFTAGNPAACAMFGAGTEAEFTALGPWDISPERQPDGRPSDEKAAEMIATAMREGSHFFEWTHKQLNGEDFPCTVLLTRIELAGQAFLQATVRDITEQKRAEQDLRASEETISGIIDSAPYSIQLLDPEGYTVRVNQAFVELFGVAPPPDYTILSDPNFDRLGPQHNQMKHLTRGERVHFSEHYYNTRLVSPQLPDTPLWIRASGFPLFDSDGNVKNLVLIHEDITERKRAEEALQQQAEELRARNDELDRFNRVAIGRELAMIELKREVNDLCGKLGERPRHRLAEDKTAPPASTEAQA